MKIPEVYDINITRTGNGRLYAILSLNDGLAVAVLLDNPDGLEWHMAFHGNHRDSSGLIGSLHPEIATRVDYALDAFLDRERVAGT